MINYVVAVENIRILAYHVMTRGRRGEEVFKAKEDYDAFIALLKDKHPHSWENVPALPFTHPVTSFRRVYILE